MKMWALSFLGIITEMCKKEVCQSAPQFNLQRNVKEREKENAKAKRTKQSRKKLLQNKTNNHKEKREKKNNNT